MCLRKSLCRSIKAASYLINITVSTYSNHIFDVIRKAVQYLGVSKHLALIKESLLSRSRFMCRSMVVSKHIYCALF